MELAERSWNRLGIVDTIYEEEDEDSSSIESTPSPTPPLSSSIEPCLRPLVRPRNLDPDVRIHVQGSSFSLHKEALIARSGYLKRHLDELSEITLSPPLNITAETFSLVAEFCYGGYVVLTPFNVAALRTAAELLEMTESRGPRDENLRQKTEAYFCRAISVNEEYASIVLRSCLPLLPEAETTASLFSRCVESLSLMTESDGELSCLDGVEKIRLEDFQLILESMSQRLTHSHDLVYRIIDFYLKENNGKVSEEQKSRMCNYIDCSTLSPRTLMHAVQNHRMPLRFVVQAMFMEQLNTRRSIISASTDHHDPNNKRHIIKDPATLGALLQRDAALRQVSQLKSVMNATHSRIQSLEKELNSMRKLLNESENIKNRADSGKSASFRLSSESSTGNSKIGRGETGSISSLSYRDVKNKVMRAEVGSSSGESSEGIGGVERNFRRRIMNGLKNAFRLHSLVSKKKNESKGSINVQRNRDHKEFGDKNNGSNEDGNDGIVIIKKNYAFHRRSRSQS